MSPTTSDTTHRAPETPARNVAGPHGTAGPRSTTEPHRAIGPHGTTGPRYGRVRTRAVTALVVAALLLVAGLTLATGTYRITPSGVWQVLHGGGSALDRQVVLQQRLPRLLAAVLVGACLATSGAVFQTLSRNPLGSPDVLGFTTGCATGALVTGLAGGLAGAGRVSTWGMGAGAVAGGLVTVGITLAIRRGRTTVDDALVLTGIALAALLSAVNDYLLTRADLEQAEQAKAWLYGSLNGVGWVSVVGPALAALPLLAVALAGQRWLRVIELGDDRAASLGLDLPVANGLLVLVAVALAACAVAVTGPVAFVALAAPQLAHRLWHSAGLVLWQAALLGGALLALADLVAARAMAPFQIPVGLVTGGLGGAYLVWLLLRRRR